MCHTCTRCHTCMMCHMCMTCHTWVMCHIYMTCHTWMMCHMCMTCPEQKSWERRSRLMISGGNRKCLPLHLGFLLGRWKWKINHGFTTVKLSKICALYLSALFLVLRLESKCSVTPLRWMSPASVKLLKPEHFTRGGYHLTFRDPGVQRLSSKTSNHPMWGIHLCPFTKITRLAVVTSHILLEKWQGSQDPYLSIQPLCHLLWPQGSHAEHPLQLCPWESPPPCCVKTFRGDLSTEEHPQVPVSNSSPKLCQEVQ